jgi:multicomponent Na+:H+ antiporter subunit E
VSVNRGSEPAASVGSGVAAVLARGAGFYGLWVVLVGTAPADLAVGVIAATAATWTSIALAPPTARRVRWGRLLALVPHFLWKSLAAGFDVAWRALGPRVRVNPGFVAYPVQLQPGDARNQFATFTSLMPGTLPCADEDGILIYHCLDTGADVAAALADDEHRISCTIGEAGRD